MGYPCDYHDTLEEGINDAMKAMATHGKELIKASSKDKALLEKFLKELIEKVDKDPWCVK